MNKLPPSLCTPLSGLRAQLVVGQALPINVRSADGSLLLARGQVIQSQAQLDALLERGALVDQREAAGLLGPAGSPADIRSLPRDALPAQWTACLDQVARALHEAAPAEFTPTLATAAAPVLALIERDPDLAIFQILSRDRVDRKQGVTRAVHAGIAAQLAAEILGWTPDERLRAFKATLTMNMAMLDLQGQLASQVTPLTPLQREVVDLHPRRSRELLEKCGVTDGLWLDAVEQHHEQPDGRGYPSARTDVIDLARLLHTADVYTSMLSVRSTRSALPSDTAARRLYGRGPGDPMVAATIKAFGLYPPGAHVRLVSGEVAVVMERGPAANQPIVASLINAAGEPMAEPLRRDTAVMKNAVIGVVPPGEIRVRVPQEKLLRVVQA